MKRHIAAIALALSAAVPVAMVAAPAAIAEAASFTGQTGDFVRKSKRLNGSYEVIEQDGQTLIRFSDDFRAAGGPDLKAFLSPKSISDATGQNATEGAIRLGELTKTRGGQDYVLPEGVDLADFGSVLVHCEAYSVLWGGANL